MKKYFTLLFAFSALAISPVLAQKDFRSGYIIQKGDTVKGLVAFRNNRRSALSCSYKTDAAAEEQNFSPTDIQGYGFSQSKRFETVTLLHSTGRKQPVFMELLIKGKATLYTFQDSLNRERFFLLKDNNLQELEQKVHTEVDKSTGSEVKIVDKTYQRTLSNALNDCKNINPELAKTQLKPTSLISLFTRYNTCFSPARLTFARQIPRSKFSWGPVIGTQSGTLKIIIDNYFLGIPEAYKAKTGIYGGIFFNGSFPRVSEKISFQLEAVYMKNKFEATFSETAQYGRINKYDINFDVNYLKFPLLVRYTFPQGKIRPYFNVGLLNAFALKFSQNAHKESSFTNTNYAEDSPPLTSIRKYNQGLIGGVGVNVYNASKYVISLEGRYERANGFSNATAIKTLIHTYYVQMGVGF